MAEYDRQKVTVIPKTYGGALVDGRFMSDVDLLSYYGEKGCKSAVQIQGDIIKKKGLEYSSPYSLPGITSVVVAGNYLGYFLINAFFAIIADPSRADILRSTDNKAWIGAGASIAATSIFYYFQTQWNKEHVPFYSQRAEAAEKFNLHLLEK
jgi:hypothetical protein